MEYVAPSPVCLKGAVNRGTMSGYLLGGHCGGGPQKFIKMNSEKKKDVRKAATLWWSIQDGLG